MLFALLKIGIRAVGLQLNFCYKEVTELFGFCDAGEL